MSHVILRREAERGLHEWLSNFSIVKCVLPNVWPAGYRLSFQPGPLLSALQS